MSSYVLGFQDIDKTKIMVVGGKGANLGEISKVEGIRVPDGFCISTEAFKRIIGETPSINELLDQLSLLKVEDRNKIRELSGEIRRLIVRRRSQKSRMTWPRLVAIAARWLPQPSILHPYPNLRFDAKHPR
jgi:phosphoenolpyruvate synthase/pyruvate phosphate dikinase